MSLYEMIQPKCSFGNLVLPDSVASSIDEVLEDHEFQEALLENGLSVRKKILLYGPPGCGKTSIAHALANELKMKLCAVSAAQTVEGTLGSSEKNTEAIFKFAQQNKVVMLIDEFDSIGTSRGTDESAATKSTNRVVNTLLTNMESRPPLGLIVACTNLFDSLDEALLRRFDLILEIPAPSRASLKKIAESVIQGRFGITTEEILDEASTPASVVQVATNKLRQRVIAAEKERRVNIPPLSEQLAAVVAEADRIAKKSQKPAQMKMIEGM